MSQDLETPDTPTPLDSGPAGIPETPPETWGAPPPGFQRTAPPGGGSASPAGDPIAGATTTTTPTTSPWPGDVEGAEWDGERSPRRPLRIAKTAQPFIEEALGAAGELLNARSVDVGGHPEQWLTDGNDLSAAEPIARIIDRYLPASALGDPNVRDAIEAGLIMVRYLVKQAHLALYWRRAQRIPEAQGAPAAD